MLKKHTTLHSAAITGCKLQNGATSAIDVALNHDATTVGKPTGQTPDTFSIVDLDVVDSTLPPSQRNTDNRPTMDDIGEA